MRPAASSVMHRSSPMDPFRPCGPHPGMPPASRASRPRARGQLSLRRPWASSGPPGHLLRARATTLARTYRQVLFLPVRPRTSSTASRSPFPVRGATTLARTYSQVLSLPVRSWTSSAPTGHLPRARGRLRFDAQFMEHGAEGCVPPGSAQRLPAIIPEGTRAHKRSVGAWR